MDEDDEQFRAGQLLGRIQTLRDIMQRLTQAEPKPFDPADPLAIYADIEDRHRALFEWVGQAMEECQAEVVLLKRTHTD